MLRRSVKYTCGWVCESNFKDQHVKKQLKEEHPQRIGVISFNSLGVKWATMRAVFYRVRVPREDAPGYTRCLLLQPSNILHAKASPWSFQFFHWKYNIFSCSKSPSILDYSVIRLSRFSVRKCINNYFIAIPNFPLRRFI